MGQRKFSIFAGLDFHFPLPVGKQVLLLPLFLLLAKESGKKLSILFNPFLKRYKQEHQNQGDRTRSFRILVV